MDGIPNGLLREILNDAMLSKDQGILIKYTTSIIFSERSPQSPGSFLSLPRRIAPFPHLLHIGFLFGYRKRESLEMLVQAVQEGRPVPNHLRNGLALIGMPVDGIQMAAIVCPKEA